MNYILYFILILLTIMVTFVGLLVIKAAIEMAEKIYYPSKPKAITSTEEEVTFKEETKKRYQRKSNTNATKRISKSTRKV